MKVALRALVLQQSKAMQPAANNVVKFLNYCATNHNSMIQTRRSVTGLPIWYLYWSPLRCILQLRTQCTQPHWGHLYMGSRTAMAINDASNQAVLSTVGVMKAILSQLPKAETESFSTIAKRQQYISYHFRRYGPPATGNHVQTNNSTSCSIANDNIKQQWSQAINGRSTGVRHVLDMRLTCVWHALLLGPWPSSPEPIHNLPKQSNPNTCTWTTSKSLMWP